MWRAIAEQISAATGRPFAIVSHRSVGGGSINRAFAIEDAHRCYFLKVNSSEYLGMFEAEALGLQAMRGTGTLRVPEAICWGAGECAYLVLEWLDLRGSGDWEQMGEHLAALHRASGPEECGWTRDNTIGSTPQPNTWTAGWAEFFTRHRLGYQLALPAARAAFDGPTRQELLAAANALLSTHRPRPALLHGDLWSGNVSFTAEDTPVVFDPAVYYGDREVDLAMSELFGGFPPAFYRGYRRVYPLEPGYEERKTLYNLYHVLNHLNLFGGGYASQANRMIRSILGQAH